MSSIRPGELDDRLESGSGDDLFLLDVRPESSFRAGAIDDSHNVPVFEDLQQGNDDALWEHRDEIPTDKEIVVVCKRGIAAERAASLLEEEGYDAKALRGGINAWAGYQNGSLGYKLRSLLWKLR